MCSPSALGDAALAPANAPTPDPGGQPGLRGGGGGFVALSGAVRLASKWTAVSAGRSGFDPKWASSRSDSLLVSRHMGNAANYGEILDV